MLNPPSAENGEYALSFDGVDDFVRLPFGYQGEHPLTIEVDVEVTDESRSGAVVSTTQYSGLGITTTRVGSDKSRSAVYSLIGAQAQTASAGYLRTEVTELPLIPSVVRLTMVVDNDGFSLFVNGKKSGEIELSGTYTFNDLNFVLGASPVDGTAIDFPFRGIIHRVRFSDIARYDQNHTPAELVPDEHTIALYRFDEGQGSVLSDSSGNGHHGKIVGARWMKVVPASEQ
ncbi:MULTISPECIES: LamG-like jellyroll fold domain-containing protein [Pirellulaceae]|uniref:LamG-like jellyroll fold domain-containing protein n=1 Tax=Pirellulaceae TaxID=2691357 RepID=UPI001304CBE6|nr:MULTISPECIES: LamG-like jellyroll fold domain-containing protein [Pirellulaceae]